MRLTRRGFSKMVSAAPVAAMASPGAGAIPTRRLGALGLEAGILSFGAQQVGRPAAPQATVDRLVAEGIEAGVNYIDTAPNYGASEELLGPALKGRRERVFLSTKIEEAGRAGAMAQIRESLRRMRTDYLDCVQFHNLAREDRWPDLDAVFGKDGALAALLEAKKQGMIRHIGATTHSAPSRMIRLFGETEVAIVTCVLNFVDRQIYRLEETLLPEARKRGIAVVAMKALGGPKKGGGARLDSAVDYPNALRYVWSLPGVQTAIVGYRTPEELRQGLAVARGFKPLSGAERQELAKRGRELAAEWGPTRGPVTA